MKSLTQGQAEVWMGFFTPELFYRGAYMEKNPWGFLSNSVRNRFSLL